MTEAAEAPREVLDWVTYGRAGRRWINFPWSTDPPILDAAGRAVLDA